MAQTYAQTGLTPQQWDSDFFRDYVRSSRYKRYFGADEAAIFQLKDDLTKKKGDSVTFALVNELTGNGVTGNNTLKGNEERLGSRSHRVTVNVLRHAVSVDDWDTQKSVIDLRNAARVQLREWSMKMLRDACTNALGMIDGTIFTSAAAGARNTWWANNSDRVLAGTVAANYAGAVFATDIAKIGLTEQLTPNLLSALKRKAQMASPKIKPVYVKEMDQEWYVVFVGPYAWRDLTEDNPTTNVLTLANRDARVRGTDNPLFTGDSLVWDGMIIREIPEIAALDVSGSAGGRIEPVYLAGAQAVGIAWAQRTKTTTDVDDYEFMHGAGIQEIRGIEKLRFGTDPAVDTTTPKDHGIATAFVAAATD
jgi:N4-gp56 family major capsid protein